MDRHDSGEQKLFLHYGDLSDSTNLVQIFRKCRPAEVYNLAAMSHVKVSFGKTSLFKYLYIFLFLVLFSLHSLSVESFVFTLFPANSTMPDVFVHPIHYASLWYVLYRHG